MLIQQMVLEQVDIHRKKKRLLSLYIYQKSHFEWCIDKNVHVKTIKILAKSRREYF